MYINVVGWILYLFKVNNLGKKTLQVRGRRRAWSLKKMASSTSGSSKRARGANNGAQPVLCLVDGCNSDLSNCRDYHRRHKVCELHSKTPQVTIGGLKQRFCQQCSRFHSLEEFDEGKRSCRKRLDGHNRRRRKPQADLIPPRTGSLISYHQGSPLLPYSTSQVFPSTTVGISHGWSPAVAQLEAADPTTLHSRNPRLNFLEKQNPFVESSDHGGNNYKSGQHLSFLQTCHEDLSCQPLLRSINTFPENGGERNKMVYDRFTIGVSESDCALSLLSSPPTRTAPAPAESSSGLMGLSRIEQRNAMSLLQPLNHSGFENSESVRIPNDSNGVVNFTGIFEIGSENAGNESPSTLPFHWE